MSPSRQMLVRRLTLWLVIAPGIPFLIASAGIVLYANAPGDSGLQQPAPLPANTRQLTLITHGLADNSKGWVSEVVQLMAADNPVDTHIRAIDWSRGAGNLFRCSRNADRAGRELANSIADQAPVLQQVHLVAHSAGAFLAYGFCQQLKHTRPDIQVNITYLDPAGVYRGLLWNYGYQHFGSCAANARTIFHVGDGVPGSEAPPQHGLALDISALRPADDPNGHLWPVRYFINSLEQQTPEDLPTSHTPPP